MATMASNDTVTTIGIDLGKNVFHIVGMNARGAILLRERLSRAKLPRRLANMTSCLIGMEACAGAHHIGWQLMMMTAMIKSARATIAADHTGPQIAAIRRSRPH